jgi:hypothetical protein
MMDGKYINPLHINYPIDNNVTALRELSKASVFKKINKLACEWICL